MNLAFVQRAVAKQVQLNDSRDRCSYFQNNSKMMALPHQPPQASINKWCPGILTAQAGSTSSNSNLNSTPQISAADSGSILEEESAMEGGARLKKCSANGGPSGENVLSSSPSPALEKLPGQNLLETEASLVAAWKRLELLKLYQRSTNWEDLPASMRDSVLDIFREETMPTQDAVISGFGDNSKHNAQKQREMYPTLPIHKTLSTMRNRRNRIPKTSCSKEGRLQDGRHHSYSSSNEGSTDADPSETEPASISIQDSEKGSRKAFYQTCVHGIAPKSQCLFCRNLSRCGRGRNVSMERDEYGFNRFFHHMQPTMASIYRRQQQNDPGTLKESLLKPYFVRNVTPQKVLLPSPVVKKYSKPQQHPLSQPDNAMQKSTCAAKRDVTQKSKIQRERKPAVQQIPVAPRKYMKSTIKKEERVPQKHREQQYERQVDGPKERLSVGAKLLDARKEANNSVFSRLWQDALHKQNSNYCANRKAVTSGKPFKRQTSINSWSSLNLQNEEALWINQLRNEKKSVAKSPDFERPVYTDALQEVQLSRAPAEVKKCPIQNTGTLQSGSRPDASKLNEQPRIDANVVPVNNSKTNSPGYPINIAKNISLLSAVKPMSYASTSMEVLFPKTRFLRCPRAYPLPTTQKSAEGAFRKQHSAEVSTNGSQEEAELWTSSGPSDASASRISKPPVPEPTLRSYTDASTFMSPQPYSRSSLQLSDGNQVLAMVPGIPGGWVPLQPWGSQRFAKSIPPLNSVGVSVNAYPAYPTTDLSNCKGKLVNWRRRLAPTPDKC